MDMRQIGQKKTEEERFRLAIQPFAGSMQRFCSSLAGSVWDGEDLFQISMIKIYRAWLKNPSRSITKAYLYRIISNAWIDGHRKVSIDETVTASIENFADHREKEKIAERLAGGMKVLISRLPAKQRLIFLLIAGLGCNAAEAAGLTGESEGNVRVAYHRARKKLASSGGTRLAARNDELADRYVAAFRSHIPEQLLHVYQQETETVLGSVQAALAQPFILRRAMSEKAFLKILARLCLCAVYEGMGVKASCNGMAA